jgi:hypothetical protein
VFWVTFAMARVVAVWHLGSVTRSEETP